MNYPKALFSNGVKGKLICVFLKGKEVEEKAHYHFEDKGELILNWLEIKELQKLHKEVVE